MCMRTEKGSARIVLFNFFFTLSMFAIRVFAIYSHDDSHLFFWFFTCFCCKAFFFALAVSTFSVFLFCMFFFFCPQVFAVLCFSFNASCILLKHSSPFFFVLYCDLFVTFLLLRIMKQSFFFIGNFRYTCIYGSFSLLQNVPRHSIRKSTIENKKH